MLSQPDLDAIGTSEFRDAQPFPWLNPENVLTPAGFDELRAHLPPLTLMNKSFGRKRAHGQTPHDRYSLEYAADLPVADCWHQLVEELEAPGYQGWLARLFDTRRFRLNYHWHYTPRGASVSPHCDARHKLGSHIFYFHTAADWDPAWGGETVILDDEGRFSRASAPPFEAFTHRWRADAMGNRSLLFQRQGNSWHGVEPLQCPEGQLRKVFIVVVNASGGLAGLRRLFA
ncbi:MAG: 2OG-Fe(II) oxygenase [Pseudomonadales bacterium]